MTNNSELAKLVEDARGGDQDSLNLLTEKARQRLVMYVQRLTLDPELTQDIVQESLIEMCRFLGKLEHNDRFWPWLRRIATNKLHHHHAREKNRKAISVGDLESTLPAQNSDDGFAELVSQELREIVLETMATLKPRYRKVLVLRCYEEMDYADIAQELGGTEFGTRVLFHRAKNALARQLARRGLGKAALGVGLLVFGKMTATSEAAAAQVCVTGATMQVGWTAAAVGTLTGKTAVATAATVGVIALGSTVVAPPPAAEPAAPTGPRTVAVAPAPSHSASRVNTCWFFYPQGPDGPVMMRRTLHGDGGTVQWLENDQGNYRFAAGLVVQRNAHFWNDDLSVRRLPTDSAALNTFVENVQPGSEGFDPVAQSGEGLLVIAEQDRSDAERRAWTTHYRHVLNEDYFRSDWPTDAMVVDERDALHRQGGCYFRISGQIDGERVIGRGRMPFVYSAMEQYDPWLKIQVGERIITDTGTRTYQYDRRADELTRYDRGAFFAGLARPWAGLHAIDTVRRDAAGKGLWWKTHVSEDRRLGQVAIYDGDVEIVYGIDMEKDWIERIVLYRSVGGRRTRCGRLEFSYVGRMDLSLEGLVEPSPGRQVQSSEDPGVQWLLDLAR